MKQFFNNIISIIIMAAIIIIGRGTAGYCWEKQKIKFKPLCGNQPQRGFSFYGAIFDRIKKMNTTTFNKNICNVPALSVSGSIVVSIAAASIIAIIISIITSSGSA